MGRLCNVSAGYLWLGEEWVKKDWSERGWKKVVNRAVAELAGREWREEVVSGGDLGSYGTQLQELKRADYIRGFKGGD